MTLSPYIAAQKGKNKTGFKKRYNLKIKKQVLKYGTLGLVFNKQFYMELTFLKFLKKQFKLFFKKKKNKLILKKKNWLFLTPNFLLTKKSKNSRMGKGKGTSHRWVINIKGGNTFFETKSISWYRMNAIKKKISKKLNIPLVILITHFIKSLPLKNKSNSFWYM